MLTPFLHQKTEEHMKILAVGDVYGTEGISCIEKRLRSVRSETQADLVIVNGENCAPGNGMDVRGAQAIFEAGADVITGGNHSLRQLSCHTFLEDQPYVLRPLNFPDAAPGKGYCIYSGVYGYRILVINVQGQIYMNSPVDNPFNGVERLLTRLKGQYDFAVCDFHGEATSEKAAFAACFDGRISAIWGTHTHVQTADERVLPGGSGFISDLGMCGVEDSIIGTRAEQVVKYYKTHVRTRYEAAEGKTVFCGCLFDIDPSSGRCLSVKRIRV
ncbi:MAG: TIGR00282 family metallophosphoesterase [Ruminococcaceae bacterium]|nr:TIGR00282 family metallophosphoesterase [Oscillospiraceae bacterium]